MRQLLVAGEVGPVGPIFIELAVHHRQPYGMGIGLILFCLAMVATHTWLHGFVKKSLLWLLGSMLALALGLADFSSESSVAREQNATEETMRRVIDQAFQERRTYLDERFESIEAILSTHNHGESSNGGADHNTLGELETVEGAEEP